MYKLGVAQVQQYLWKRLVAALSSPGRESSIASIHRAAGEGHVPGEGQRSPDTLDKDETEAQKAAKNLKISYKVTTGLAVTRHPAQTA